MTSTGFTLKNEGGGLYKKISRIILTKHSTALFASLGVFLDTVGLERGGERESEGGQRKGGRKEREREGGRRKGGMGREKGREGGEIKGGREEREREGEREGRREGERGR